MLRTVRLDAPLWAFLVTFVVAASSLGCFGLGFATAQASPPDAEILDTNQVSIPTDL